MTTPSSDEARPGEPVALGEEARGDTGEDTVDLADTGDAPDTGVGLYAPDPDPEPGVITVPYPPNNGGGGRGDEDAVDDGLVEVDVLARGSPQLGQTLFARIML